MTTIAILGANGRLGSVVAKAFFEAGHEVRAVSRAGKLPAGLSGAAPAAADALDRTALIRATAGAEIIFNGLNPVYTDWKAKCMPLARNVMAAAQAHGALHLFPGNVYNFGSPMPVALVEDLPFSPTSRKGAIRAEMEALFADEASAGRVQTAVLRAGDFFGGAGRGSWFDLVVTQKLSKGVFTAPGSADIVHEWAYLPDLAQAFVKLAGNRARLRSFENLHFPGHPVTALELRAAAERALGRPLKLGRLPWWLLRAGGAVAPMWREIAEMSYLHHEPHSLVSARLESLIGEIPHTPLERAVAEAFADLGVTAADGPTKKRAA